MNIFKPRYGVWMHEVKVDIIHDDSKPIHRTYDWKFFTKRKARKFYGKVVNDMVGNGYHGSWWDDRTKFKEWQECCMFRSDLDRRIYDTDDGCRINTYIHYGKIEKD